MSATDKHADFTKRLTDLITDFHKENPDLYVNEVGILTVRGSMKEYYCIGVRVEILTQPYIPKEVKRSRHGRAREA